MATTIPGSISVDDRSSQSQEDRIGVAAFFISSRDQARIGLLMSRSGIWNGRRLLSRNYIDQALTPLPGQSGLWFSLVAEPFWNPPAGREFIRLLRLRVWDQHHLD